MFVCHAKLTPFVIMEEPAQAPALRPGLSVTLSVITAILGFVVIGQLSGILIGGLFYPGTMTEWINEFTPNLQVSEKVRIPLLIMQGCGTAFGLILTPWLYLKFIEKISIGNLTKATNPLIASITVLCVAVFMLPNSVFIEWNYNITFPGSLDKWIRETEETATAFTKFITNFTSLGNYLLGLVVIAVLPAIGEELAFRGMIQPSVHRLTGNIHVAIWVTAAFFSAFHFQFLGFIPRLMLGAMFGYMMAWSGNLWIPIIAHFTNNALGVTLIYIHQLGWIDFDTESPDAAPWTLVVPGTILLFFLVKILHKELIKTR